MSEVVREKNNSQREERGERKIAGGNGGNFVLALVAVC